MIRSWVVHMKVEMPSSHAVASTSAIASSRWKRMSWARARSCDMWLTPKNWLSPSMRRGSGVVVVVVVMRFVIGFPPGSSWQWSSHWASRSAHWASWSSHWASRSAQVQPPESPVLPQKGWWGASASASGVP